jgi:hypothetical protein
VGQRAISDPHNMAVFQFISPSSSGRFGNPQLKIYFSNVLGEEYRTQGREQIPRKDQIFFYKKKPPEAFGIFDTSCNAQIEE